MSREQLFLPQRRGGLIFQIGVILLLLAAIGFGLWRASQTAPGLEFLLYLLVPILASALLPMVVYRLYGLLGAYYSMQRDGVRLRWGLRVEEFPLTAVIWVRPARELNMRLPLPHILWPGAILGTRHFGSSDQIEYLASDLRNLVVIATRKRLYAISPEDPVNFVAIFERMLELGSLSPIPARSLYPGLLFTRAWNDRLARSLILAGLILGLVTLSWVSLAVPAIDQVSLGFNREGLPRDLVPAAQLLLLPVLYALIFIADLFSGLFFYRKENTRFYAYLLWIGSIFTGLLFLAAIIFILWAA